jgi:hypothetical protein
MHSSGRYWQIFGTWNGGTVRMIVAVFRQMEALNRALVKMPVESFGGGWPPGQIMLTIH